MNSNERLSGKVAFVTGGSRGIGAAIVRRLASEGATVTFTYNASADRAQALVAEVEKAGGRAFAVKSDAGDASALQGAIDDVARKHGRLDILVTTRASSRSPRSPTSSWRTSTRRSR